MTGQVSNDCSPRLHAMFIACDRHNVPMPDLAELSGIDCSSVQRWRYGLAHPNENEIRTLLTSAGQIIRTKQMDTE